MPMERMSVRKIKEILRLHHEFHFSERQIAKSCQVSRRTIGRYVQRAKQAGLSWPLPAELDDVQLEALLYPHETKSQQGLPDWPHIHQELKKKGVTLFLLWEEYQASRPEGISYSRFCQCYRAFKNQLDVVMRQTHKAGEKLFVDYAGMTLPWIDKKTGEVYQAQIFVAVLGASNYTYVEATRTQTLPDWIGAHQRAFQFYGGVPEMIVPDNLKSGVSKAHLYDPDINPTYQEMACHYGVAIIPARVRKPKDKAKVEVGVQGIERRILAKLRDHTFFSIAEMNAAITPLLADYNQRRFQQMPGSRHSEFLQVEQPALKALPSCPYQYAEWKKVRLGIDYHMAFEQHYYSAPYQYKNCELSVRITGTLIECFYKNKSIALHQRAYQKGHTTVKEHMPKHHQAYAEWTPERLVQWAKKIGHQTAHLIDVMMQSRAHPQQAFRACLGVLRLGKHYGEARLEKAAERALAIGALSYQSIESILKRGLDQQPLPAPTHPIKTPEKKFHENVRGAHYFH